MNNFTRNQKRTVAFRQWLMLFLVLGVVSANVSLIPVFGEGSSNARWEGWRQPPLGLDMHFYVPESNPITSAKIALGERLFFDPILSVDRTVKCASCHRPEKAFADSVPFSKGVHGKSPARNTPSVLNRAYGRTFFLDGRLGSLERTVLQPIQNHSEMGMDLADVVKRLNSDDSYSEDFADVFGEEATKDNLAFALASYVRSLRSGGAPIDRFRRGEVSAISEDAAAGWRLFVGKANCIACHTSPNFTDEKFHNTGVFVRSKDIGREGVTGDIRDRGAFKTPSLRNVALTAPYMHDGSLKTLEEVVEFYDCGGGKNRYIDGEVQPLGLSEVEKRQLVALLKSFTGTWPGFSEPD